jgi:diguanylate cyclase (GGDEF)-like protein
VNLEAGLTELMIPVLAAFGAALVLASVLVVRAVRAHTNRRIEAVARRVDDHLGSISDVLREAVERSEAAQAQGVTERELTFDLEELLTDTVAEAAARTGAEAVAIRVQGPSGAPMTAMLGGERGVDWTDGAAFDTDRDETDETEGRLAVPILEGGVETGVIVAHARTGRRFLAGHRRSLLALAEETAVAVSSARRFTRAASRVDTDEVTGVHNRRGYEAALEREVTSAVRTGRPLAVVLLALHDMTDTAEVERFAQELSALLGRVSRATDTVFRRCREEFGVLLPETTSEGAQRFHGRLRAELERSTFSQNGELTLSTGISEWRPDETSDSFDARARASVGSDTGRSRPRRPNGVTPSGGDARL